MAGPYFPSRTLAFLLLTLILCAGFIQATPVAFVYAQEMAPVQEIAGKINPGEIDVFLINDLKQGQVLYGMLETTSGNLDPALTLLPASVDVPDLIAEYRASLQDILQTSEYPLADIPALNDRTFLAWDDDSGRS